MPSSRPPDLKKYFFGTHRVVPPETTWQRIRPLLSGFGITRVADITGLDYLDIPTFQAVRPLAHSISVSQGKGLTSAAARVSAAMEAIELYHAERIPPSYEDLSPAEAGPLPYRPRDLCLAKGSLLSETLKLAWVDARTVVTGQSTLLPHSCVKFSLLMAESWSPPVFFSSTNGLASGNSIEEATLHGLYELIERDSAARSYRHPATKRRVIDPDAIDDPICTRLIQQLRQKNVNILVSSLESRFEIPCFEAQIWTYDLPTWVAGWGCHLNTSVALARAITEAAQARLTIIAGSRDDLPDYLYEPRVDSLQAPGSVSHPGLNSSWTPEGSQAHETSIGADLRVVAQRVQEVTGWEPLMVDCRGSAQPVAVVRVVAPSLEFNPQHRLASTNMTGDSE